MYCLGKWTLWVCSRLDSACGLTCSGSAVKDLGFGCFEFCCSRFQDCGISGQDLGCRDEGFGAQD